MSWLHDRIALNQVRTQGCSMCDLSPLIANYQSNNCIKWLSVSLLWPHHIVRCQSPEEFSLVFPLNTVHVLDFSIFSSLSLLSGYGACVPTTPKVPAVPQHKLGTQASGAFSGEKSTSLPSLLPYKVLWHPVWGNAQRETRHTSLLTLNPSLTSPFKLKPEEEFSFRVGKGPRNTKCGPQRSELCHVKSIYNFLDQKWNPTQYQNTLTMGKMCWKR